MSSGVAGTPTFWECDPVLHQARIRPQRTAVIDAVTGYRMTYDELDGRISRTASALSAQARRRLKGERIAVLARNSVAQVVVIMACQRLGAVFTPLNWRLSPVELAALVADAEPALLIHDEAGASDARASAGEIPLLALDDLDRAAAAASPATPDPAAADDPCIILYTSGTTGRPKGAILTGRNVWCQSTNMAALGEVGPTSVMLCDTPLFHTVGLVAVTRTTLIEGGVLVMTPRFEPAATLRRLSDPALGITHYFCVPQMAATMREEAGYADADLSGVTAIFTGGAPLAPSLIEAYARDGVTLVNGFGMTETGTGMHMPLDPAASRRNSGCVGYPAPLISVRLVGSEGRDAPEGEAGELWVRGPSVTAGYWRQPEATAAAFTADGWFKTGDVAQVEPGGVHRIVDRIKDMYVSGGENVYPAEVEAALLAHADVLEAAVVGAPDPRWGECGVAFLVMRSGASADAATIYAHCEGRLARYKRPASVYFVGAIERTPSGKARKDRLRALLAEARGPAARESQAPAP